MWVRDILAYDSWGSLNNYNEFNVIVQLIKIKKITIVILKIALLLVYIVFDCQKHHLLKAACGFKLRNFYRRNVVKILNDQQSYVNKLEQVYIIVVLYKIGSQNFPDHCTEVIMITFTKWFNLTYHKG